MTDRSWIPRPRCCWCQSEFVKDTIEGFTAYFCPSKKCAARQIAQATYVDDKIVDVPLPKQVELIEAVDSGLYTRLYYGGALGGSKSHALRRLLAYRLCRKFQNFKVLLLRRTIEELKKHHIQNATIEQFTFGAKFSDNKLTFIETGSFVQFGHCQHPESVAIWLSTEYDLILFDELPTFIEDQFIRIASRTGRTEREDGWPGCVVAAGNPGEAWIEDLFIRKQRDPLEYPDYDPTTYHFIPAVLEDNPYVKTSYVKMLADLPPDLRNAWRFGSWDRFVGQFFPEFSEARHVTMVELGETPRIIGAMRWGFHKPGYFLWGAVLPDGRLHCLMQYPFVQTVPAKVAETILEATARNGWTFQGCWGHREMGDDGAGGEDVFLTLQQHGLFVMLSHHETINGYQRIHDWLSMDIGGQPALTFNPACDQLIRTLPRMVKDDKDPEDIKPSPGRDQATHALRYLVMSQPRPSPSGVKLPPGPGTAGELMTIAMADARRLAR